MFDRLNKLYEIFVFKRDYKILLSARNLQQVVRESKSYVVPVVPRRLPRTVVPGEHFVLKDLPFYEEAREADAKAR